MDPTKEQSDQLTGALTVHPVSDPEQMYRLHRFFTELELQKAYSEIGRLQVSGFQVQLKINRGSGLWSCSFCSNRRK